MTSYRPPAATRYPSEPERAVRAVLLGLAIGAALVGLARPRDASARAPHGAAR